MWKKVLFFLLLTTVLISCSPDKVKHKIGVSQCSADIWRDKQNAELKMGAYFHENVELKFAAAYDSDERQVQQIDSLVDSGIDLLIVAPNQVQTISPAIDRAYDKGIPVIVFERKTSSQKYTAFISADNYEMGHTMGDFIVNRLHGQGTILEIRGLAGSSPSIDRHNGFMESIKDAPGIKVVGSLQGDWTEPTAYEEAKRWLADHQDVHVDLVFGANDRTAMGARKAFSTLNIHPLPLFCGVDGLPGKDGGIQLVRDSILEASYIYPTHGDRLLQLAVDILDGKPYSKKTFLQSAIVTHGNADVLQMESEEIMRQAAHLEQLHEKADTYLRALDAQRVITWLSMGIIALLLVLLVLFYLYHLRKIALQHERVVNTLWNLPEQPAPVNADSSETVEVTEETVAPESIDDAVTDETVDETSDEPVSAFFTRFKEVIAARLEDSEVSVEDLASDMNLSRVQLYRKVKALTGSSPVELLRTARLSRAYHLLLTTDKSVSEVAYAVGFTAPSYFTKCFKEEYGMVPGDVRK